MSPSGDYAVENLTDLACRIKADVNSPFTDNPAYSKLFEQICRSLYRQEPRHLLMVRDRGVAERTILIELARRGNEGNPPFLRDRTVFAMDFRRLTIEEIRPAIEWLGTHERFDERAVVCLDGFANFFRRYNPFEPSAIVFAALARIRCRIIGVISPRELEEIAQWGTDAHDMFAVIDVHEPDLITAMRLVRQFAEGLRIHYGFAIDEDALQAAVALSNTFILNERLPAKAVKILRSACEDLDYNQSQHLTPCRNVAVDDVIDKISSVTGIPVATLSGIGDGIDYYKSLSDLIVGQDHAVREMSIELGLIKAGMIEPNKPASVIMFVGQTGTGKTEMAKALAKFYSSSRRLKTFTLGNFSEPHSVSGIIGVPPGYVGHEQGGRLINELNADPYGVFLLDEADKAHPDVMQPFLNLFDEGWIIDQKGNKAFAHRAIFILTTNVGQRQISDMCRAGKSIAEITSSIKESLARIRHTKSNRPVFSSEFLARIKRVIVFRSLDEEAMLGICRRLVFSLQEDWKSKRDKLLRIPEDLVVSLSRRAFAIDSKSQGREGGRIVRKLLTDFIEAPILGAINTSPDAYRGCRYINLLYADQASNDVCALLPRDIQVHFTMQ